MIKDELGVEFKSAVSSSQTIMPKIAHKMQSDFYVIFTMILCALKL